MSSDRICQYLGSFARTPPHVRNNKWSLEDAMMLVLAIRRLLPAFVPVSGPQRRSNLLPRSSKAAPSRLSDLALGRCLTPAPSPTAVAPCGKKHQVLEGAQLGCR
jgi:hypothetical protein